MRREPDQPERGDPRGGPEGRGGPAEQHRDEQLEGQERVVRLRVGDGRELDGERTGEPGGER